MTKKKKKMKIINPELNKQSDYFDKYEPEVNEEKINTEIVKNVELQKNSNVNLYVETEEFELKKKNLSDLFDNENKPQNVIKKPVNSKQTGFNYDEVVSSIKKNDYFKDESNIEEDKLKNKSGGNQKKGKKKPIEVDISLKYG